MILLNEQTNNKLYTSKEYVNAKQIMLSRCVAIKIAVVISPGTGSVVNCKLLFAGRKSITFFLSAKGGGGGGGALIAAANVTCAVQVCVFCIFFWKIDGKKISI